MARQVNAERYLIARKSPKLYMKNPHSVEVQSITTAKKQVLFLDKDDADYMRGKRVLIVDDVISTGESAMAVEKLVTESGEPSPEEWLFSQRATRPTARILSIWRNYPCFTRRKSKNTYKAWRLPC
jgi:hypoxanthine phosphoribosyltransferase